MKRPRTASFAGWMCAKGCRPDGRARTAAAAHVLGRAIRGKNDGMQGGSSSDLLARTFRVRAELSRRDTWFPVCDGQAARRRLQRRQEQCKDSAWGCMSRGNDTKCDQWRRRIRRLHRHGKVAQRQMQSLADRPQKWREDRWQARDRRASISCDASADLLLLLR